MEEKGLHSAKLGLFLLLQNMHFRHPWRSGIKPRRQGDKFPWEALGYDVQVHVIYWDTDKIRHARLSQPDWRRDSSFCVSVWLSAAFNCASSSSNI